MAQERLRQKNGRCLFECKMPGRRLCQTTDGIRLLFGKPFEFTL